MLGRWDEALDMMGEFAAEFHRRDSSDQLEYCLYGALTTISFNVLGQTSDEHPVGAYENQAREENVALLEQIAAAYRRRSRGDAHERDHGLAVTLKTIAKRCGSWAGRGSPWPPARRPSRFVVGWRAAARPSISPTSRMRCNARRTRPEAAAAADEAARIYHHLVRDGHHANDRTLAATLHRLATNLRWFSPAQALAPARWAAEILQRLAHGEPATPDEALATVLDILAAVLELLGREEVFRAAASRAATVRDRLTAGSGSAVTGPGRGQEQT
ncbi:hypothetical protein [Nonomuraea sp. NPDC052265]|uniref:hypothetical protein n=1 Tax=Nonomuraea sp. NPDC052265 TaxID=3364374 RepID=UPI0037C8D027